jgi:3-oxoacyl-[acyl-carrier-protein] synthase-3
MDGGEVFNFVLKEIPSSVKKLMADANVTHNEIDFFVFHQANKFMNGYLQKKFKIEDEKYPLSIAKFGNTSSVSIPLTIVSELESKMHGHRKLLLSGFGVGMSWASCVIETENLKISKLIEI